MIGHDQDTPSYPLLPPDGGYGWVVIVGAVLQMSFGVAVLPNYGLLFGPKFEEFNTTPTEQAILISVLLISWNLVSLFVGPLSELYGSVFVACVSTFFVSTGLLLTAFANSTGFMFFSFGIVVGIGIGLGNINNMLIINKYFKNRSGTAMALMFTGLGVMAVCIPQIVKVLVKSFSGQQTLLIYSAISTLGFVGSILLKDVKPFLRPMTEDEKVKFNKLLKTRELTKKEDNNEERQDQKRCCETFIVFKVLRMIEWKLLLDPYFIVIALGISTGTTCIMNLSSMIRSITSEKGLDEGQTADILTIVAVSEICTRNIHGFLADSQLIRRIFVMPRKLLYTLTLLTAAAGYSLITMCEGFIPVTVIFCFCAIFNSGSVIHSPLVFADTYPQSFASAFGLSNVIKACVAMLLGPVLGKLNEISGSTYPSLYFMSSLMVFIMLVWIIVDLAKGRCLRKHAIEGNAKV